MDILSKSTITLVVNTRILVSSLHIHEIERKEKETRVDVPRENADHNSGGMYVVSHWLRMNRDAKCNDV